MALVGSLVTLPYYSISPGTARQVNDLISVDGARSFPPRGEILFTTVSLRQITPFEVIAGWWDDSVDVYHRDELFPPTVEDPTAFNQALMAGSKETAVVVALRHLGFRIPEDGSGALVLSVFEGFPAAGKLKTGQTITKVGNRSISTRGELLQALSRRSPGDEVELTVRNARNKTQKKRVVALADRGDGSPVMGVEVQTANPVFDLPFEVDIDSGAIGGPSAGLAFTLAVLDSLTKGELTGGAKIAVTGTIEMDGRVGPVGGVAQKAEAVRASGAEVFLVPSNEFDNARRILGDDVAVERVDTLDDALVALARYGGNALALTKPKVRG